MTSSTTELPDEAFEHNGMLWKPKPGAASTPGEFLAARTFVVETSQEALWNPWIEEDRAEELQKATAITEEWVRGEPGFRYLTKRQLDAKFAKLDREFEAQHAADVKRWEQDRERYDPDRAASRLALLEQESILAQQRRNLEAYRSGERFPGMVPDRRAEAITELENTIAPLEAEVERLNGLVGDREDVVDEHGYLPGDRRKTMLVYYQPRREKDVRELRGQMPELKAALKASNDRAERAKIRLDLESAERRLTKLLAVPPLTADDMCSECPKPAATHGWVSPPYDSPCPAWPGWGARIQEARKLLLATYERLQPKPPEPPKPQPLAVLPSGLQIAEVIERLTELQAEHPNAVVKRGRASRWEIWPADD